MKICMNLIRRKNGVYYVVWRENGKQYWRSLKTKDKAEAKRLFKQFKRAYLQGKLIKLEEGVRKITLNAFAEEYFTWLEKAREPRTAETYRDSWDKFAQLVGNINLNDITRKHIDIFVQNELSKGNKPITVNKDLRSLKAIFSKAVEWEYLKENPLKGYKLLKVDRKPPRALTKDEIIRLLSAITDDWFRLLVAMAIYTGCRRNELLNLTWEHIDLENRIIYIEKTKNHQSRYIPISNNLMAVLTKLRTFTQVGKLFPKWSPNYVTHRFKEFARKAGLPDVRFHDLRHTFATHLISEGVPLKVLQELLGHQSINATMIYAHAMEEQKRKAVEKLELRLIK